MGMILYKLVRFSTVGKTCLAKFWYLSQRPHTCSHKYGYLISIPSRSARSPNPLNGAHIYTDRACLMSKCAPSRHTSADTQDGSSTYNIVLFIQFGAYTRTQWYVGTRNYSQDIKQLRPAFTFSWLNVCVLMLWVSFSSCINCTAMCNMILYYSGKAKPMPHMRVWTN